MMPATKPSAHVIRGVPPGAAMAEAARAGGE